jgi:hypothetical protein
LDELPEELRVKLGQGRRRGLFDLALDRSTETDGEVGFEAPHSWLLPTSPVADIPSAAVAIVHLLERRS